MTRYRLRKVHSCEHCGTEEQSLDTHATVDDARAAAAADAHRPLTWDRFSVDDPWPLVADPEDGVWSYMIDRVAQ
ncbi:hypothetical protein [Nocardia sp. NPDC050406]|uniref:hypothetical protein n=1 Tax=Nocardia sp. NPDC050406 TaxID=3364318 RepID=UPI0037BD6B93